jgi:hypothetical protein
LTGLDGASKRNRRRALDEQGRAYVARIDGANTAVEIGSIDPLRESRLVRDGRPDGLRKTICSAPHGSPARLGQLRRGSAADSPLGVISALRELAETPRGARDSPLTVKDVAASPAYRDRLRTANAHVDPVLLDEIDNQAARAYGGWPDRLYLIGADGRVAFQGAESPFGFKPDQLEEAIEAELAVAAASSASASLQRANDTASAPGGGRGDPRRRS